MLLNAVVAAVVLSILLFAVAGYNALVQSRTQVQEAWSGIDVQLRRRADLIPGLVETVRGYAQHERQTFDQVIRARGALQEAGGARDAARANEAMTHALGRLFAVVEGYPQLRASENFKSLQADLADTEEKISYARRFFNRTVLDYNTRVEVFPTLLIARAFGFTQAEFFEADERARSGVRVSFESPAHAESTATPPAA